jgi:hypothetical protein
MRTLCIEGLAIRGDPESCAALVRVAVKRWQGCVQAWLLSREIKGSRVPTPLTEAEGNIAGRVIASGWRTPRGRRTGACTESPGARTGRSRGRPCPSATPSGG